MPVRSDPQGRCAHAAHPRGVCKAGGSAVILPRDLKAREILHQPCRLPQAPSGLAIHRRAGTKMTWRNDEWSWRSIEALDHHFQDGGTVRCLLTQWVSISRNASSISKRSTQRDGRHAARFAELMDAGAMRQRRNHQGRVVFRRAGHQVREVVSDKAIWPWVSTRRLGATGGAWREEEPAGIVVRDISRLDCSVRMGGDHLGHGFSPNPPRRSAR